MNDNLYTDAAQLVTTFADPVNTVNGLESELVALRRQYADQSDELATAQDERDALMKLTVNLHEMLSEAGVPPNGTLSERIKLAFERTEQAWLAARLFEKAFDEAEAERRAAAAAARRWKAAAKRWRESYHALDIQYAHRELERNNWKLSAKRFRRRWRDACAELAETSRVLP